MNVFFFICLGVGAGFVVISVLLGQLGGIMDFDVAAVSPFKPILIAFFLTVFGGLGLIFVPVFPVAWMVIGVAAAGGLGLSYLIFRFVVVPLHRWQNTSAHDRQSTIGVTAKVAETIPQGGYGKISYTYDDKILSGPARSEDGNEIERNTVVEIVYIEKNTYHVRPKI
ncbi:MAG: NfeD family protein [Defluviitaleaceae bacterium]|nr:NfeD family protein [Defluviitaleaceae bacterium]